MVIVTFFVAHWLSSVFFQTFFLHRYGAHRMFTMSKGWERFFYLSAFLVMGPSFLVPRGYAILHRMHHAFSDTEKDPHSPRNFGNVFAMMWSTKTIYHGYAHGEVEPEKRFDGGYPEWKFIDRLSQSWFTRIGFGAAYAVFYFFFATHAWMYILLPYHFIMGPIHGAIVNWAGHRYGYRNFDNGDDSKNALPIDFVTFGELFQNNHHKFGMAPKFAARWFEIDPAWYFIRVFAWLKIIDFGPHRQIAHVLPAQPAVQENV